jgi:tetratricopeptide (TPR) repeat protein
MRTAPIVAVPLAVAVLAALSVGARAQDLDRHIRLAWVDAVNSHVPGQHDEAVDLVAPWSWTVLESLYRSVSDRDRVGKFRLIRRALVLHTDIAILSRTAEGYRLPSENRNLTIVDDGRGVGQMSATSHWEFARSLLTRVPEDEDEDDRLHVGRVFYRASAAMLQFWGEYPELTLHLDDARRFLGEDAVLLLYEGTQHQAYAGPRVQRFLDERRRAEALRSPKGPIPGVVGGSSTRAPSVPARELPSAARSRREAARLFRRAISLDPSLDEARVRLAHVLFDDDRPDEARVELDKVSGEAHAPFLGYYKALIEGRVERALGRLDRARIAFERAASIYPNAQAPVYSSSELALAQGDRRGALAQLLRDPQPTRIEADEPWWWLDRVHAPPADVLIEDMRRDLTR